MKKKRKTNNKIVVTKTIPLIVKQSAGLLGTQAITILGSKETANEQNILTIRMKKHDGNDRNYHMMLIA